MCGKSLVMCFLILLDLVDTHLNFLRSERISTVHKQTNFKTWKSFMNQLGITWAGWLLCPSSIFLTGDGPTSTTATAVGHLRTSFVGSIVLGPSGEPQASWFLTHSWKISVKMHENAVEMLCAVNIWFLEHIKQHELASISIGIKLGWWISKKAYHGHHTPEKPSLHQQYKWEGSSKML